MSLCINFGLFHNKVQLSVIDPSLYNQLLRHCLCLYKALKATMSILSLSLTMTSAPGSVINTLVRSMPTKDI
jgi:hypothetical protein